MERAPRIGLGLVLLALVVMQAASLYQQARQGQVVDRLLGIVAAFEDGEFDDGVNGKGDKWKRHRIDWPGGRVGEAREGGILQDPPPPGDPEASGERYLRIGRGRRGLDGHSNLGVGQTFRCGAANYCVIEFRTRFTQRDNEVARVRLKGKDRRGDEFFLTADIPVSPLGGAGGTEPQWVVRRIWIEGCDEVTIVFSIDAGQASTDPDLQSELDIDTVAPDCIPDRPNEASHGDLSNPDASRWTSREG